MKTTPLTKRVRNRGARTPEPDAVLIAPDRCTKYLASAIDRDLDAMSSGAVLEVRVDDADARAELAEWCLGSGRRVLNPFAHWSDPALLIENTAV